MKSIWGMRPTDRWIAFMKNQGSSEGKKRGLICNYNGTWWNGQLVENELLRTHTTSLVLHLTCLNNPVLAPRYNTVTDYPKVFNRPAVLRLVMTLVPVNLATWKGQSAHSTYSHSPGLRSPCVGGKWYRENPLTFMNSLISCVNCTLQQLRR